MNDETTDMRERLTRLETTVGEDSESGVRGDLKEIKESISTLSDRFSTSERRYAMISGGGIVLLWILEHVVR